MRSWRFITLVAALYALAAAVPATAQETRGSIEGVVKDATGGALPGVTVTAKHYATSASQSTVSDANGVYRFPALPVGLYAVAANLSGFNPTTVEKVDVKIGDLLKIDLVMTVAGVTISETVRGELPMVDVKQNAVTSTVSGELIDLLPKGRDYLSALTMIPGTNYETDISGSRATGLLIDGASQSENRFLIDGQDTTNLRTGTSGKDVIVDFIDQIQVKQSGYAAEFRATTGGVVSAITKSGTNSYHGDIAADYRGKLLNGIMGDVRPTLTLNTTSSANNPPAEYVTTPRTTEYERYTLEPVYDIGGPVMKNRMWFFFGYNPLITNQDRTVQWLNPVSAGVTYPAIQTYNKKDTDTRYLYNLTLQLTQNLRARVNGNNQRLSTGLALPNIDATTFVVSDNGDTIGVSNSNPATFNPRTNVHRFDANDSYSATLDWVIDNKTYANFTGGYLGALSKDTGGDYYHGVVRTFNSSNIGLLDVPPELQNASNFSDNPTNSFRNRDNYYRYNIQGDLTRFVEFKGQHAFKVGLQYERLGNDVDFGNQYPVVQLFWNQTRTTLDQRQVRGKYGYYTVNRVFTIGNIKSNNLGFFIQDQWTMNQKLTLNYGLRMDQTNLPSYRPENPGITFGWGDKVAPRLGFAYDIKGDSKWKAFGSWGLFYDIEKLEMPRGAWGADHSNAQYWTLDTYDWPSINCTEFPDSACPGTWIEQNDLRHVSNDPANNLVDPNLKPYKSGELVFGLDHELTRLISVGTRYTHKWVYNAIEDVGVQVPGVGEVFYIANPGYGLGAYPLGTDWPRSPFPVRDYDGVEVNFRRRLQNNWSFTGNFLISRLNGNYSGLSNNGSESNRNSPNVTRLWDGLFMNYTEKGCPPITDCDGYENYGRISTDRPFQLKLQGTYIFKWGTSLGVTFVGQSGNLQTSSVTYKGVPVQLYATGDLARTTTYSNTDINLAHTVTVARNKRITMQFNVTNLFDQDFTATLATSPWRDALVLPNDNCTTCAASFFAGFDTRATQAARNAANPNVSRIDPRYRLPSAFRGARTARLYLRFSF